MTLFLKSKNGQDLTMKLNLDKEVNHVMWDVESETGINVNK